MNSYFITLLVGLWACGVGYGWLALGGASQTRAESERLRRFFRIGGPVIVVSATLLFLGQLVGLSRPTIDESKVEGLAVGEEFRHPPDGGTFEYLQKNQGTPRSDGWTPARSLGCGFAVDLVGPYNEFKITAPATDGATVITYAVGTETVEGCKLLVMCISREDEKIPSGFVRDTVEALAESGHLVRRLKTRFRGHESTRVRLENGSSLYGGQLLRVGHVAYLQSLECPVSEADYFDHLESLFLASLNPTPSDRD